jgi:hypothetical protein
MRRGENFREFEVPASGPARRTFEAKTQADVEALILSQDYYLGDDEMRRLARLLDVGLVTMTEPGLAHGGLGQSYVLCNMDAPLGKLKSRPVVMAWLWKMHYRLLTPYDLLLQKTRDLTLPYKDLPPGVEAELKRCAEFFGNEEAEIHAGSGAEPVSRFRYLDSIMDADLFDFTSEAGGPADCEPLQPIEAFRSLGKIDIVIGPGDWLSPRDQPERALGRLQFQVGWRFAENYRLKADGNALVVTKACFAGPPEDHGPMLLFALKLFLHRHGYMFDLGKPDVLQMPMWKFHADVAGPVGLVLASFGSPGYSLVEPDAMTSKFAERAAEAGLVVGLFPVHGQETGARKLTDVIKEFGLVWSRDLKTRPLGL